MPAAVIEMPAPASAQVAVASPFPDFALPRAWGWMQKVRWKVADDFAPESLEEFIAHWDRQVEAGQQSWAVYRGEEIGGLITILPLNLITVASHCVFRHDFWGSTTTLEALRQVYAQVFDAGYLKISSLAFADNELLLGLARKLGAGKEGVLRQQTMRGGKPTDMMAIGLLRADFERQQPPSTEKPPSEEVPAA